MANPRNTLSRLTVWDKYANYLPEVKRRENWDEIVMRLEEMYLKLYPNERANIIEAMDAVRAHKILPSMRSAQFGGDPLLIHPTRNFNCFARDTKFLTIEGYKTFEDFNEGEEVVVLTHKGNWKKAIVKSYGEQSLNEILIKRGKLEVVVKATANHRWILRDGSFTTELKEGDKLSANRGDFESWNYEDGSPQERLAWCYGFVYGDGTCVKKQGAATQSMVRLCGDKIKYLERFEECGFKYSYPMSCGGDAIVYTGKYTKSPMMPGEDPLLVRAFVWGWLNADGGKAPQDSALRTYSSLQVSGEDQIAAAEYMLPIAGNFISSRREVSVKTNYGTRNKKTVNFGLISNVIGSHVTVEPRVNSINRNVLTDTVWCLEVEDDQSFTLEGGIHTGNCAFLHIASPEAFAEVMYCLLAGSGVGYSVQAHHVNQLPVVKGSDTSKTRRYRVHDQIEGWADAILMEVKSHFDGGREIRFDMSDIRGPDKTIKSSGRKAPGSAKLSEILLKIRDIFKGAVGRKLKPLEVHDICCWIAWCVVAGGVRRSAMISLYDHKDLEMRNCKAGAWWEHSPQRGRANNSELLVRGEVTEEDFRELMRQTEKNRTGEPAPYWTNDRELGTNPCAEIALRNMQFCNLTSINFATVLDQSDFLNRVRLATYLGTLQAGFTDFLYLRDQWVDNCEEEALLGVSITGICENLPLFFSLDFDAAAETALTTNAQTAGRLGIREAARALTIKPEGSGTLAAGAVCAGVHDGPGPYWIKHFTLDKNTDLYKFLMEKAPSYVVDSPYVKHEAYFAVPLALPEHVTNSELNTPALDVLERIEFIYNNWVAKGHRTGANTHNVSCTVRVRDSEWSEVTDWMWEKRNRYGAISFLHIEDLGEESSSEWTLLPQQVISKEQHDIMVNGGEYDGHHYAGWIDLDFDELLEETNNVDLTNELACAGGACLI